MKEKQWIPSQKVPEAIAFAFKGFTFGTVMWPVHVYDLRTNLISNITPIPAALRALYSNTGKSNASVRPHEGLGSANLFWINRSLVWAPEFGLKCWLDTRYPV